MSVQQALAQLPERLRTGLTVAYNSGGGMVDALMERGDMEPTRALMAGLAMDPAGRPMFEDALNNFVGQNDKLPDFWPEVIVGGGAHAAIWASMRRPLNSQGPLVLEARTRFGGTFAMTRRPSFFLNSRNRPGPSGGAGSRDALNVILGAPMQPSDLSGAEYQANADVGLVVRCTLALNSVVRQARAESVVRNGDNLVVVTNRGTVRTKRVVVATGPGSPVELKTSPVVPPIFTFSDFMRRFDTMFPLRNLGRVAVLGAGDSGRTAVEALTGYGPYTGGSVASLDYVPRIDWYGVDKNMTKERWLECNRTRYKPLAALFRSQDGTVQNDRVTGRERVMQVLRTPQGVQVNGSSYDTVVLCFGFTPGLGVQIEGTAPTEFRSGNEFGEAGRGTPLGLASADRSVVVVGTAADLPFDGAADPEPRIPQNRVALFRLAPRTAAFAQMLPYT